MNGDNVLFGLIMGVFMVFCINWVYFFDWLRLIGWILSLIAPEKKVKEIEDERKLREKKEYKRHQRKWKLRFLIVPVSFTVAYLLFSYIAQQIMIGYFCGIFVILLVYAILEKLELRERKALEKDLR